ncbi:MAG: CoA pyrophosphatase [Desulfovibrio sp.]|nr:CoA pyrophosphatase [Desulfovibrio sp.]
MRFRHIAELFNGPLPGKAAQRSMAAPDRRGALFAPAPQDAKQAAVAVLLRPPHRQGAVRALSGVDAENARKAGSPACPAVAPRDMTVLLIRRNIYPGVHSGQIAFPGGQREDADADLRHTARRETREEVGIRAEHLFMLGPMTELYVRASNFLIHPFAALLDERAELRFDPEEVVGGRFVPVRFFDPALASVRRFAFADGTVRPAPAWKFKDYTVWGATAMILAELHAILGGRAGAAERGRGGAAERGRAGAAESLP